MLIRWSEITPARWGLREGPPYHCLPLGEAHSQVLQMLQLVACCCWLFVVCPFLVDAFLMLVRYLQAKLNRARLRTKMRGISVDEQIEGQGDPRNTGKA